MQRQLRRKSCYQACLEVKQAFQLNSFTLEGFEIHQKMDTQYFTDHDHGYLIKEPKLKINFRERDEFQRYKQSLYTQEEYKGRDMVSSDWQDDALLRTHFKSKLQINLIEGPKLRPRRRIERLKVMLKGKEGSMFDDVFIIKSSSILERIYHNIGKHLDTVKYKSIDENVEHILKEVENEKSMKLVTKCENYNSEYARMMIRSEIQYQNQLRRQRDGDNDDSEV
ncbi:hypothetical protein BN7_6603 [Wickerhamomyces ciferrii]|uniref:Uncharacterized protein n=1 Tax=Wickerhamomyces ciferrii (strain ATCC 14091 / BCRC 22168 / CBS 111 / JCM 3599 / NBRC 0793 / NRRL Y-1031 F-60-10) TaxID=1206466 RepID=K0KUU7_WICCF|nr:uncharacterized protein BN7_6603 [Wickerhamomyces ciferrii]CCH46996.1 hypothetical protein BN7_6603 [Wickerhamomyces ciferrii]